MKKLKEIQVSAYDITQFSYKNVFNGEWHPADAALSVFTMESNFVISLTVSKGNWSYAAKRSGIQFVCDNTHDFGTIMLAFTYLRNYPDAQKMLWHYLTGNEEELEVDTEQVFKEDEKLKKFVFGAIQDEMGKGKKSGSVNVNQTRYGNDNWRNAFGSINIKWIKAGNNLELWIEDTYKWHPGEVRVSQCVHQAMARAQQYGAKAFKYHGSRMKISLPPSVQNVLRPVLP